MNIPHEKKDVNNAKRRLIIESFLAFLIILSPFIFKLHEYIPEDPDLTLNFLGLEIEKNGFQNVSIYIWVLLGKIVPLYLFLIWFFTCKHWWYHIILIPVLMYTFQIYETVYGVEFMDTENLLWLLPFCMVVIPFVYFIRVKLYDKYVHGIDLEAMDAELQYYREKERQSNHFMKDKPAEAMQEEVEKDLSDQLPKTMLQKMFKNLKHSMQCFLDMIL